ncbi:MAG: glycosyltransferase family 4 protein, partial [Candidatus Omnitrophica bacterium]|nr:glycosyltransferase family 4 protein [Candidatus Omnitrophota bacterium]
MNRKKSLHIVIAGCGFSFPLGEALTSRVRLLASALDKNGASVRVLHFNYSERPPQINNLETKGAYKGIDFEYTTGNTIRPSFFISRCWLQIKGLLFGLWRLRQLSHHGQLDCLCLYGRRHRIIIPIIFICRLLRVPVILDLCEWWPVFTNCSRREKAIFFKYILEKVSGVITISEHIREKLKIIYGKKGINMPILKVPILVDSVEWQLPPSQSDDDSQKYVLWCGSLSGYPQTVKFLMRVMLELSNRKGEAKLKLVGAITPFQIKQFRNYQRNLGLTEQRVEFVGYKRQEELKQQFSAATALLVPVGNTERELCGFHTKTGEYLASGCPIVTTNIGEPANYFKNGVNAMLCKPEDAKDFAHNIQLLLDSPQRAKAIGEAGQELAKTVFDYRIHGP